jgi:hypothetical protein
MAFDNETWLLDVGDIIVQRKTASGYKHLSAVEQAIYCFWIVDYAVRNAGDLAPIQDMHPTAIDELERFAASHNIEPLYRLLQTQNNEQAFCESYYANFEGICNEFRRIYDAT